MKNQIFKFFFLFFTFTIFFVACQEEIINIKYFDDELTIEKAKELLDNNSGNQLKYPSLRLNHERLQLKAYWKHAFKRSNKDYSIVEVPLESKGRFGFMLPEAKKKWKETGEDKYLRSLTRLVFREDRKSTEVDMFFMTFIYEPEYMEKKGFKVYHDTYLKRKNLSGFVLYHSLEGIFVNGWKYEDGKIIAKVRSAESDLNINLNSARTVCTTTTIYHWEVFCTVWYQSFEVDGQYSDGTIIDESCSDPYMVVDEEYTVCEEVNDDDDDTDTGGYSPEPTEPTDITKDSTLTNNPKADCILEKLEDLTNINGLLSAYAANNNTVNLTYKAGYLSGDVSGQTTPGAYPYTDVTITIDESYIQINKTVRVARTFLHEAVHAQIYSLLRQAGGYNNLNINNFPELWQAYMTYTYNQGYTQNDNFTTHHQYMAEQYINIIAGNLAQFDVLNHNNPDITFEHYQALAWEGLMDNNTIWIDIMTQEEKDKIYDKIDYILDWNAIFNCY